MIHIAKVRYVDEQNRSHHIEIESDVADRRHIEELVRCRYPAKECNKRCAVSLLQGKIPVVTMGCFKLSHPKLF